MGRLRPLHGICRSRARLSNICMPQGRDGVQVVALSIRPLCRHDITRSDRQIGNVSVTYVTLVPWWRERRTLCPHATILNHRWVSGTRSWLLSVKPDQWMHLSPIYTRVHGEWLRYANSTSQFHWCFLLVRDDWGFQVNPLCRHDITSPFPPSGNEGYVRNRDVPCRTRWVVWSGSHSEL